MHVTFVRTEGQPDRIYVERSDGSEASWSFPTYGDGLPHDLVHLVVEAAFGLRRGLWGLVDSGIDMARVNAEANRKGGADKYGALGDRTDILLSEALAAAVSAPYLETNEERLELLREGCEKLGLAVPAGSTAEKFSEMRALLAALSAEWRTLKPKGSLRLSFSADRGFTQRR